MIVPIIVAALASCGGSQQRNDHPTADGNATEATRALYSRLFALRVRGVLVGHQDDTAYGRQRFEAGYSDVEAITGDYPAVMGWELGHIELGNERNLDSVRFDDIRRLMVEHHNRGGINTVSWHADNIVTGGSTWDCEQGGVVAAILPGGSYHSRYLAWLDRLAAFFGSLTDGSGEKIPVVFRMYHEQTSSWFWWGARQSTPEEYKNLWRMTVDHLQDKGVHNLLYAYSPSECENEAAYLERYPGDDYVDVVGFDVYYYGEDDQAMERYMHNISHNIDIVTGYADKSGKLPIVAETGMEGIPYTGYFTDVIAPLIGGSGISWILFWRNAWEPDKPDHFYMPYPGHPSAEDLRAFVLVKNVLMLEDLK